MLLANGMTMLEALRATRALLAERYVKWTTCDSSGGSCQLGCLRAAIGLHPFDYDKEGWEEPHEFVNTVARDLHPELVGCSAARPGSDKGYFAEDYFDVTPAIYVNNQLGKAAILAVYDEAIRRAERAEADHAELNALCAEEAAKVRDPEPEPVPA